VSTVVSLLLIRLYQRSFKLCYAGLKLLSMRYRWCSELTPSGIDQRQQIRLGLQLVYAALIAPCNATGTYWMSAIAFDLSAATRFTREGALLTDTVVDRVAFRRRHVKRTTRVS